MGLDTVVFIVENPRKSLRAGYTKDLEVTLDLIRSGRYEPGWESFRKLVYREEVGTVREAASRVAEIEAMSPGEVCRLVDKTNPGHLGMFADGRFGDWSESSNPRPFWVYVIGDDDYQVKVGYTADLLGTIKRLRRQWLARRQGANGTERLVYREIVVSRGEAMRRSRHLRRFGRDRLVAYVRAFNSGWMEVKLGSMLLTASSGPSEGGGSSSGGVSAVLPGGPRSPRGTRSPGYEQPLPPEE